MTGADVVVVGAGAAGLMAAIHAGRRGRRALVLDGAERLGAKILVAGGGRCNVTHETVTADAYAGASRNAIRKVLRRFDVPETVAFFESIGVRLKREGTGKLFPVTDSARTVLDALLRAARDAGAELAHPRRVRAVRRHDAGFEASGDWGAVTAARLVLATGGRSLPKTGSDGAGYGFARALGHSVTERIVPALVPLVLEPGHAVCGLSGIATPARLTVRSGTGKHLVTMEGDLLCTHFGLSGPLALDISRHWTHARLDDPEAVLEVAWTPGLAPETLDELLREGGRRTPAALLHGHLPERLARALCAMAEVDPVTPCHALRREERRRLVTTVTACPVPVTGDRGFRHAEVTAGGVPLTEIDLTTMESRLAPGLHLCGELCDVDGRIGGFNFQWAWASGFVVGSSV